MVLDQTEHRLLKVGVICDTLHHWLWPCTEEWGKKWVLCPDSIWRCLTSIANLIMEIRQSWDRLSPERDFSILVRWHLTFSFVFQLSNILNIWFITWHITHHNVIEINIKSKISSLNYISSHYKQQCRSRWLGTKWYWFCHWSMTFLIHISSNTHMISLISYNSYLKKLRMLWNQIHGYFFSGLYLQCAKVLMAFNIHTGSWSEYEGQNLFKIMASYQWLCVKLCYLQC